MAQLLFIGNAFKQIVYASQISLTSDLECARKYNAFSKLVPRLVRACRSKATIHLNLDMLISQLLSQNNQFSTDDQGYCPHFEKMTSLSIDYEPGVLSRSSENANFGFSN